MQANGGEYLKSLAKAYLPQNSKAKEAPAQGGRKPSQIGEEAKLHSVDSKQGLRNVIVERSDVNKQQQLPNSPIEIKHIDKCVIDKEIEFTLDDFLSDNENILLENNPNAPQQTNKVDNKNQYDSNAKKEKHNDSLSSMKSQRLQPKHKAKDKKGKKSIDGLLNDYNQLQMMNKIEMMKDFEKINQLKDLEKVQRLIEIDKAKKTTPSGPHSSQYTARITQPFQALASPNQPMMPYQWEYQQQMMMSMLWQQMQQLQYQYYSNMAMISPQPQYGYSPSPYPLQNASDSNKPRYCSYCEEVYKYTIVNNLPFKLITCAYCQSTINQNTLDYFLVKYKDDIYENYSSQLNKKKSDASPYETPKQKGRRKLPSISFSSDNKSQRQSELSPSISNRPMSERRVSEANKAKEATETVLNASENNISLAQAFKRRHLGLINKIEKRAVSAKDNSLNSSKDRQLPQQLLSNSVKGHSRRSSEAKASQIKPSNGSKVALITINNSNIKPSAREPSAELLDRLIHGKRAKMTPKEMKELNKRLIKNLSEVKYQQVDDQKQQSLSLLSEKKVQYTQSLKQSVVSTYKTKHAS